MTCKKCEERKKETWDSNVSCRKCNDKMMAHFRWKPTATTAGGNDSDVGYVWLPWTKYDVGKTVSTEDWEVSQEKEVVHNTSGIDRDILSRKIANRIRKQWTLKPNYEEPQDISTIIREELPQSTKGNTLKPLDVDEIINRLWELKFIYNPVTTWVSIPREDVRSIIKEYGTEQ